jgi:hypothetical protein
MIRFILILVLSTIFTINMVAQTTPPAGYGNNIILWLSPDTALFKSTNNPAMIGDRIREWHDISGGGYIFTNAGGSERPKYVSYQGKNMLNFVNGDLLENSTIASIINGLEEFSIYIVIKSDDLNTDQGFLDSQNPDGADDILCMRYDASGANTGRSNVIKCGMQGNNGGNQVESLSNTQSNLLQCLTLTWKKGEKINLYIDGDFNESSNNILNSNMSGIQKILLGKGSKDTGAGTGWDGRIGTVIFYNKKMSADTVSEISGDLKAIKSVQSGNWDNPTTWDCNCNPSNNAFVKIMNGHTVSLTTNETANDLIIASGGNLDLSTNNRRLTLKRNLTNNGIVTPREGTIRMNGTVDQFIKGSSTTQLYNLTINKTGGNVSITSGNVELQGTLNIQSNCLDANGRLTLLSNPTGTARIAELSGTACINGDITMQRYIDAGATDWRFITSPINGASLSDLNDDFITSGFTGSDFPNWPSPSNPWSSIYFYNESIPGIQDNGFVAATNTTNTIQNGEGIWVWCGDTITGTQPFTIDFTGPPNTGDISLPISYTSTPHSDDGWNMVGNPYPSTINWNAIPAANKNNINDAIYIWDPDNQQFASYVNGIAANNGSRFIASSQAFWVQANGSGASITVTESSKRANDIDFLKPASTPTPLRLKATNNFGSDETVLNFDVNATNNFDALYDAGKMASVNADLPYIASITSNEEYSINQIPEQEISIPIKITTGANALHQIDITNASEFANVSCLILEDLFTGNTYDLNTTNSITTYLYDTTTVARFLLHIGAPYEVNVTEMSCYGNNDASIQFAKNTTNAYDIVWKDGLNNIINTNTGIFSSSINNLSAGTYYIETTDAICGNSIDTVTITSPSQITSYFSNSSDTLMLGDNFTPTNQSSNAISYGWVFGDGNTSNLATPTHTYNQIGSYLVNLRAQQTSTCYEDFNKLITVVNATGINNINALENINTWINNGVLNVTLNAEDYKTIEIRNTLGQQIYSNNIADNHFKFDLNNFSNGVYYILIADEKGGITSRKVVYSK